MMASEDGLSGKNRSDRVIENMQQTTSTYNNKNKTSKKADLRNRRDMEATTTKTTSTSNRKTTSKNDGLASSSKAAVTATVTVTNKPLGATVASTIISTLNSISNSSTLSNQQQSLNGNNESLAGNSSNNNNNNDSNNEIVDDYTFIRSNSTLYDKYRPEVGVRTGLILAGMLLFIIFYILWRNRCRCLRRGHGIYYYMFSKKSVLDHLINIYLNINETSYRLILLIDQFFAIYRR
jgi:hypothetical protein